MKKRSDKTPNSSSNLESSWKEEVQNNTSIWLSRCGSLGQRHLGQSMIGLDHLSRPISIAGYKIQDILPHVIPTSMVTSLACDDVIGAYLDTLSFATNDPRFNDRKVFIKNEMLRDHLEVLR